MSVVISILMLLALCSLGMATAIAPETRFRAAVAPESSFLVAGSYVQIRGLKRGSSITPGQEVLPIENALNSKGDRVGAILGAQKLEAQLDYYMTTNWATDLLDLFTAVIGSAVTTASPTFSSSADNFTVTTTGNTSPAWVKLTGNEGTPKTYYLPVVVDAAGVLTLGLGMASGVVATAIKSPGSSGGVEFQWVDGGLATTFTIETDWANKPSSTTQRRVLAKGCAVTSLILNWQRDAPIWLSAKFMGAAFTDDGGASANVSDPGAWTAEGPGWTWDWFLVTNHTTKITDTPSSIKSITCDLASPIVVETVSNGLNGGSTTSSVLPGSDIRGFTRDAGFEKPLTVREKWDATKAAAHAAGTVHHLYGIGYPGVPNNVAISNTIRTCISFERLVPVGLVRDVTDAGGRYMERDFQVERDLTSNAKQERVHLARFVS